MASGVCLTLALIHLAIWIQKRSRVSHLLFALTAALGAAGNVVVRCSISLILCPRICSESCCDALAAR
jgi:hypothetical protein